MTEKIICPKCNSESTKHIPEMEKYLCLTCTHLFNEISGNEMKNLKVFLSYGHDVFVEDVLEIKQDLESRGHKVWYDVEQLQAGRDFELYIEKGLKWCDIVVVVMTPHSVRREDFQNVGYCLNEIAKALDLNRRIIPVYLVTVTGEAPTSICRLGYVDMRDCVHFKDFPEKYRMRFAHLIDAIENEKFEGDGAQSRLLRLLKPLAFEVEMGRHLSRFTGRKWVTLELDNWLKKTDNKDSRVFWLLGGAGVGKSAIASHWCHTRGDVIAYHLCVFGHSEKAEPKRILLSIAAQMAMHLPEYFKRLTALPLEDLVTKNAKAVFDDLLVAPLKGNFPDPGRTLLVIIDALDEASHGKENELADFINESWGDLPSWLKLIITSRPESAVLNCLSALQPWQFTTKRSENLEDIREYLRREFEIIAPKANDSIIENIVNKSEGLFLYTNLLIDEVRTGHLSVDRLTDFPKGLSGYYNRWFRREFNDPIEYEKIYHKIVSIIIAQRAPLPIDVLREAIDLTLYELQKRLQKLSVLFPIREDRIDDQIISFVQPLHKSLRDWLTETVTGTQIYKAGDFAADVELGDHLLAECGWTIFKERKIADNPYFSRTLLRHLFGTGQKKRLADVLLDEELLIVLWNGDQRCEWLRHMNSLHESGSLKEIIGQWVDTHASLKDAKNMSILSRLLQQLGAFDESLIVSTKANSIWEHNGISDSPDMLQNLLSQATIYRLRDEFSAAQICYEHALSIAEDIHNPFSKELSDVLYELCVFHKEKRNYDKSWECLNRCLSIRKQLDPPDYAGIGDCINDQAVLLTEEGKPANYLGIFQEALSMFEKGFPDGHPEMATILENIASELLKKGNVDQALATLLRGLRMAESLMVPYHPKCQSLRKDLVNLFYQTEKYQEAYNMLKNQVIQSEIFPGLEHPNTAETRLRFCQTIRVELWFNEKANADKLRLEVLEQCNRVKKAFPLTVIGFLSTSDEFYLLGEKKIAQNLFKAARNGSKEYAKIVNKDLAENIASDCFYEILDLLVSDKSLSNLKTELLEIWNKTSEEIKDDSNYLAKLRRDIVNLISWSGQSRLLRLRDVNQVEIAFDLISQIGFDTPDTLDQLATLAVSLHNQRFFEESARLCQIVLERSEKLLGQDHSQTIKYVENLADLMEHIGNFNHAELLYQRALKVQIQILGETHNNTIFTLSCVAKCMLKENRFEQASALVFEFAKKNPDSTSPTSPNRLLSLRMNDCAIKLKNELSSYNASQKCYQLALELDHENAQTHSNLALLLWSCLKDIEKADMHFQKALLLDTKNGNLHSNYGLFLTHELRNFSSAQQHFEQALLLNPNDYAVPGNYASLLIVKGNLDEAWKLSKRAMQLCLPRPDRIMARPLFCAATILMLKEMDASIPLGQLRTLFDNGIDHVAWLINALVEKMKNELPPEKSHLMQNVIEAINNKLALSKLNNESEWLNIDSVQLDLPWDKIDIR
jgi:tetratricopeptide (TPR) repeat protein